MKSKVESNREFAKVDIKKKTQEKTPSSARARAGPWKQRDGWGDTGGSAFAEAEA